jgi:hypothetical protein
MVSGFEEQGELGFLLAGLRRVSDFSTFDTATTGIYMGTYRLMSQTTRR